MTVIPLRTSSETSRANDARSSLTFRRTRPISRFWSPHQTGAAPDCGEGQDHGYTKQTERMRILAQLNRLENRQREGCSLARDIACDHDGRPKLSQSACKCQKNTRQ